MLKDDVKKKKDSRIKKTKQTKVKLDKSKDKMRSLHIF